MNAPLASLMQRLVPAAFTPGSVWLTGAGPGDPGLLTLHAAQALATADVVLHDALVPPAIVQLATTPHLECVGKRADGIRTHQMRINQRLIVLARKGLRVLRLKGGDPLVFGRGGEEALALAAAGVPFRIVPGISAGLGGLAAAGIPLTHRGVAHTVAFATGHDRRGQIPGSIDLAALARSADVLVFYMALRQFPAIAAGLMAGGRPADEAVAFIADGTTDRQRVHAATLATAPEIANALDRTAPTLIVAGPVLTLRSLIAPMQDATPMGVTVAQTNAPQAAGGVL